MNKILNLVNLNHSEIKYRIYSFPDGQHQVIIENTQRYNKDTIVQIQSRLNNFIDLEKIICATKSLRELGVRDISLQTPYILGARSDRKFEDGGNNYIKDVLAPIINSLEFTNVLATDPHSDVLEACIKNFKYKTNKELVDLFFSERAELNAFNTVILSPDAGASKKVFKIVEKLPTKVGFDAGVNSYDVKICGKDRDKLGKLNRIIVPTDIPKDKNIVIIDDICDGGGTFIGIAKELVDNGHTGAIYLIVTHGLFTKGYDELNKYITQIYTTNSYSDIPDAHNDGMKRHKTKVKQIYKFF